MNHAIKEQISDNKVYVEVEPQPDWVNLLGRALVKSPQKYAGRDTWCGISNNDDTCLQERTPQISIGDTVYRGEEWKICLGDDCHQYDELWSIKSCTYHGEKQPPQTMPIELADKTFKVVGIEVMDRLPYPENLKRVWFWEYSLEGI